MTAPLRITHVVSTDQFAGLERYVVEVSAELARRGHDVRVVGGLADAMSTLVSPDVTWAPATGVLDSLRALTPGGRRDIVHSHITRADFVAALAAPLTGGARISTRHITAPRGFGPVARRLAPLVRSRLAAEIAVSAWTSEQLGRPADVVLLNGVPDVTDVTGTRDRVVLVAQRLEPEKDTEVALRAWAAAGLHQTGWRMVVAGRGTLRTELEHLAADLGIDDSVDFVGFVDDLDRLYRSASLLLAPPPTEPCGLTILEAMAHGLPVVSADAGGSRETVGSYAGAALFPPGDAAAAAHQLVRLAGDESTRGAYGRALRDLQRAQFSIRVHVDRLESVYRRFSAH